MSQRGVLLETPSAWAEPMHWPLRDGEPKLLTVGSSADWSIAAAHLLPVHAKLYFDGEVLCVAAAGNDATLNGQPLGPHWRPVALPALLSLGETTISLAASSSEAHLQALASNEATSVMAFADLEPFRLATRGAESAAHPVLPASDEAHAEVDRVTPTAPIRSPFFVEPGEQAQPSVRPVPVLQDSRAQANARSALLQSFLEASWPKRLTVLLLPIVIGLYLLPALRPAKLVRRAAAPGASAARSASPPAEPSAAQQGAAAAQPSLVVHQTTPADARASGLTLQRRAIDAFTSGNFQEAAQLYRRLAADSPNQKAYAAASQIASDKVNGAGHD